ncbi:MAG: family 78 glycoside hydrolase catalytic domain [Clostridia bacterium]
MKTENGGWSAKWIWTHAAFGMNEFAYFRKAIVITRQVCRAVLLATAHNHYKAMINGVRVSGEVTPAPSNPVKNKLYNEYDITRHIQHGENVLSAMVCYLGGSGQNYVDGVPGLLMQLELTYSDGSVQRIGTDGTWRCLLDTPYQNHTEFSHRRRIGPMEIFDARKEPDGWQYPGFSDKNWPFAVPAAAETNAWLLTPQRIQEGAVERLLTPQLCDAAENVRVYDAGKIISGWPVLSLKGAKAGQRFTLRYSEDLDKHGRVKHNVCNDTSEFYCDCYIASGRLREEWSPNFCYKAFRYCEIESDMALPEEYGLLLAEAHTGIRQVGYFVCGDPLLNALFSACIQTQKNNALGQLVDCPHREQAQYLADADLQAESLLYHFDVVSMVEKVLTDFTDGQHADGSFPFVYPSNFEHPNFSLKIPEWDLHFILLLWKLFYYTGNSELLETYYAPAENTLRRQLNCIDTSGLVRKTEDWHISDWPYPEIEQSGEYYTVHNCLVYRSTFLMACIAEYCGRKKDAQWFSDQAEALRLAIMKNLYDPVRRRFRDSSGSANFSQAVSVAALSYGVVPRKEQPALLRQIAAEGHHTSTLLSSWIC